MRFIFICFFCVVLGGLLVSCETCGISSEPSASLSFFSATAAGRQQAFTKIRVLGALKDSVAFGSGRAQLPINLNANSTTYVFEGPSKTDTLTIFYAKKVFDTGSRKCGNVLDLEAPKSGSYYKSTFKNVSVLFSSAYQFRVWSPDDMNSIYVTISLP